MKKLLFLPLFILAAGLLSCGESKTKKIQSSTGAATSETSTGDYDPTRGEGKFTNENVKVTATLDATLASSGEKVYTTKCQPCHKLTTEKLVGPGWSGVTTRKAPEWIMNFITNPDPMINKDPEIKAQLELCLVRMPNQNLTDDDARNVLEYMRKNDGIK